MMFLRQANRAVRWSTGGVAVAACAIGVWLGADIRHEAAAPTVDFNRDIRPVLNQNCTACHGGVKQAGEVSFIYREEALGKGKSGRPTIVPGRPGASELIARVTSRDPEVRMPLHAPPLSEQQIELLRQWIEEGAEWEDYWAFVAPKPQPLPEVERADWARQPLDRFILARLEKEDMQPSPEADKAALLRRVSFDLTGLPPTPEELSAFLADESLDAYEKQVDRLLASPHYGERWAAMWLDLARYADGHRSHSSSPYLEPVWPYRDWVVNAFNKNMPYDRFVIAQLAGDLIPDSTFEDLVATSFQRFAFAVSADPEESRLMRIMDRSATTWSVLSGLTMNCAQCHSHPYDPIRHEEYYKFLAFYNTTRDTHHHPQDTDHYPVLRVATEPARRLEVAAMDERRTQLIAEIVAAGRSLDELTQWTPLPIERGKAMETEAIQRYLAELRYQRENPPPQEENLFLNAEAFQKSIDVLIEEAVANLANAREAATEFPLKIEDGEAREMGTIPEQSTFVLESAPLSGSFAALRIEAPPVNPDKARHTAERGFNVSRIDAWVVTATGEEHPINVGYFVPDSEENLSQYAKDPGMDGNPVGQFAANPKQTHVRWMILVPKEPLQAPAGAHVKVHIVHTQGLFQQPAHLQRVRFYTSDDSRWTELGADGTLLAKREELFSLTLALKKIPSVPLPIMREQPAYERREMLAFERGNLLTKTGPALEPDVPKIFSGLPVSAPRDRLTMAKWFFSPAQPLTARVAVNRFWERLFGVGIMEALEDFGSATGQVPSHPELLDWLALHFQNDLEYDMKTLLREVVTSATYRQSSVVTPALQAKDPRNRLLARGPSQRLTAEMVRDQALLASGLLDPTLGGAPVMPPQPAHVDPGWIAAKDSSRYRRALYIYRKRSFGYPSLLIFDSSIHLVSLARRIPTNTPLQALVTLNEPVFHEAAQALGADMATCREQSRASRRPDFPERGELAACLNYGAKRVLSRDLSHEDLATFLALYDDMSEETHDAERLSAFTSVARAYLNLDSALTR